VVGQCPAEPYSLPRRRADSLKALTAATCFSGHLPAVVEKGERSERWRRKSSGPGLLKGFERGKAICICSTTSLQKPGSALRFKCKIRPPNAPLYDLNANDTNFCPTERVHLVAQEFVPPRIRAWGRCFRGGAAYIHTTNTFIVSMIWVCMYELEGLVEGVPFEVLNQERDSVRIDPCLATVPGPSPWVLLA
jgi:hypothetical protein